MVKPIAADLFCGVGGMTAGLEQAGYKVLAGVELDYVNASTHLINFPNCDVFNGDLTILKAEELRKYSKIGDREIDCCCASPPCQSFSLAGARNINDPRSFLLLQSCQLIIDLNPKYFVIENVKGLAMGEQKYFLTEAIDYLRANNYNVPDYRILNAKDYGVPQSRERVIILGGRKDVPPPVYPEPQTYVPTVRDAIGDLPEIENYPELWDRDSVVAEYGKPSDYARQLRAWENENLLTYSKRTKHSSIVQERFAKAPANRIEPISRFFKLDWNGVSSTLRAGAGSFSAVKPIHPEKPRVCTIRELARLQSFHDSFVFAKSKLMAARQIGNSVPPLLGKAIAEKLLKLEG